MNDDDDDDDICGTGAIFDTESMVSRTAFRYEAEQHNNSTTSTFKLDRYEKDVNILGNFELSKAGIRNIRTSLCI